MFSVRIACGDVETTADFMDAVIKAIGFRPSFNALNTLLVWFTGFLPNSSCTWSYYYYGSSSHKTLLSIKGNFVIIFVDRLIMFLTI